MASQQKDQRVGVFCELKGVWSRSTEIFGLLLICDCVDFENCFRRPMVSWFEALSSMSMILIFSLNCLWSNINGCRCSKNWCILLVPFQNHHFQVKFIIFVAKNSQSLKTGILYLMWIKILYIIWEHVWNFRNIVQFSHRTDPRSANKKSRSWRLYLSCWIPMTFFQPFFLGCPRIAQLSIFGLPRPCNEP